MSEVVFTVDGEEIAAPARQSVAAALLAMGCTVLRHGPAGGPRGLYCGIGSCFECRVHVEGRGPVLACVTPVEAGMRITTDWP